MAIVNITPELRSAKEKLLLYFHDLTACNRVCGARFFCVFNSSRASGSGLFFRSFGFRRNVLFRGAFTSLSSGLLNRFSSDWLLFVSFQNVWRGFCARFTSVMTASPLRRGSDVASRFFSRAILNGVAKVSCKHSTPSIKITTRRAGP